MKYTELVIQFNFSTIFIVQVMAETNNFISFNDCLNHNIDSMHAALNEVNPYFGQTKLMELNETIKKICQYLRYEHFISF